MTQADFQKLNPEAEKIIARYEEKRAAMLPLLWLVQEKFGTIPPEGEQWVGDRIGVSIAHVREVVSFYTLYHTQPVGKHHIQVCTTLPCLLKGAKRVLAQLEERLGIGVGQTTPDGKVTLSTVECLCACEVAPVAQINERYVGPLTSETLNKMLDHVLKTPEMDLERGRAPLGVKGARSVPSSHKGLDAGEVFPFQILQAGPASRGNMGHPICDFKLDNGRRRISSPYHGDGLGLGQGLGDRPGSLGERVDLKDSYRSIPEDGARPLKDFCKGLDCFVTNVDSLPSLWDSGFLRGLSGGVGFHLLGDEVIQRQPQINSPLLCL